MAQRRILLKFSGAVFSKGQEGGIASEALAQVAMSLLEMQKNGYELAVVVGGGNFFRGLKQTKELSIERERSDEIGMLATMMNGLALEAALEKLGGKARVLSSFAYGEVVQGYHWQRARNDLQQGYIVILSGGIGHPYFTTDTAAALRACELRADLLLKATTQVDGIYDCDPRTSSIKAAKKYERISYKEFIEKKLGVMDLTAVTLCMEQGIEIRVCNFYAGSLSDAANGAYGSLIGE